MEPLVETRRAWRCFLSERDRLTAAFSERSPSDHVECDGWDASDLLAHVVAQDRLGGWPLLLATPLVVVLPAGPRDLVRARILEQVQHRMKARFSYEQMVDRLRAPAPRLYGLPMFVLLRLIEVWVHHEDLRRAADPAPRPSDPDLDAALWAATRLISSRVTLPESVGLTLHGPTVVRLKEGASEQVVATGAPGELLLLATGRGRLATARVDGPPRTVRALLDARTI